MIIYDYHLINLDVILGQNVVMEMHFVLIVPMRNSVHIGGVIQIMAHFFVKILIVSMKHGFVMVLMIAVIVRMKPIVHHVFHVELSQLQ
jgi:hypothetical protein